MLAAISCDAGIALAEFVEMDNGADSEEPAGPPLLPEHEPSGSEDWTVVDSENEAVTSA